VYTEMAFCEGFGVHIDGKTGKNGGLGIYVYMEWDEISTSEGCRMVIWERVPCTHRWGKGENVGFRGLEVVPVV